MALNSTTSVQLLDLLCEGPIGGIIGGQKGIYLNETSIQNDDEANSYNFDKNHVKTTIQIGSKQQNKTQYFEGNDGVNVVTGVGQEIGENYSEELDENNEVVSRDYGPGIVTRQISNLEVSAVQLLFTIPKLYSVAQEGLAKGQPFNGTVKIEIYVQAKGSGTGFTKVATYEKTGISTNNYQFQSSYIKLADYGKGPWNIKVQKIDLGENHFEVKYESFEEISQKTPLAQGRANQIIWASMTEIIPQSVNYNYSATVELQLSTESFPELPDRAYLIKGRTVQIPKGSTATSDGYLTFEDAEFDGSLKSAEVWTTCPVCCFYDLLTNRRYGAGQFVAAANLNWVDLYPIAKYANQLVTNPDGTTEPRFACNVVIGDKADAYGVLQDMASVFRGILFWANNTIQVAADHGNLDGSDLSVSHIYSNSNVIGGVFEYSGSSLATRSTSVRVRYNDPENFFKPNILILEDADLIAKYGYQVKELIGFGCTSKWQAQRVGKWALLTEKLDEEVVSFTTGLQGAVVLPGEIFAVADELRQGTRISGRIASATTSSVVADQNITLPSGANPKLTCLLPNGTVETVAIDSVSDATITLSSSFSTAPNAQSIWSITTDGVANQKFRCISVADGGDGTFAITGVAHNDTIYAAVDAGEKLEFLDITTFDQAPPKVSNITFNAGQINDGTGAKIQVDVSWTRGAAASTFGYELKYSTSNKNKKTVETTDPNFTVTGLESGQKLTVEIRAIGLGGKKYSTTVTGTFTVPSFSTTSTVVGQTTKRPEDAQNVTLEVINSEQVRFKWQKPALYGGALLTAIIRHSDKTDGTGTWADSTLLSDSVSGETTEAVLPKLNGEYLIKFRGIDDQVSANAKSAVLNQPDTIPNLSITTVREDTTDPPFQGQFENAFYSDEYDAIVIDGDQTVDEVDDFDEVGALDFTGTQLLTGRYYFTNILDLGAKFTAKFKRKLTTRGLYPANAIDSKTELIDRWTDFDGADADATSADLYFRTSDVATVDAFFLLETGDNLLLESGDQLELQSDINFGEWVPMTSGSYAGRQFQFKVELSSQSTDETPLIDELGFELVMESRSEQSQTIASGAGAKAVTFTNAFYQTPSLGITAFNLASGDYYEITSPTRSGFTVTFYDSGDNPVDRTFTYSALGYGTEQT